VVQRGLYIRGKVLDPADGAIKDGYVNATLEGARWSVGTQSNDDGTFHAGPLVPGQYMMRAFGTAGSCDVRHGDGVGWRGGRRHSAEAGGALNGKVIDEKTNAPCSAYIAVTPRTATSGISVQQAHDDGAFRAQGLEPGTYDLAASTEDARVGVLRGVEIKGGAETKDLVLKVSPGARVRVRYSGKASSGSCHIVSDGVIVGLDGLENGTTKTFTAPAGRIQVQFTLFQPKREHNARSISPWAKRRKSRSTTTVEEEITHAAHVDSS